MYIWWETSKERVNIHLPFVNTGCDYAGPFVMKDRKTRNPKMLKAWICLFICLSTKAIHLEIVTDLTSDAFLACFRRFSSRRGTPSNLYSDNATTFIGANTELKRFFQFETPKISTFLQRDGVQWHFIPPRAQTLAASGKRVCVW